MSEHLNSHSNSSSLVYLTVSISFDRYAESPDFRFPSRSLLSVLQSLYSGISTTDEAKVTVSLADSPFSFAAGVQQDGSGVVVSYATHTR
jgi:hypothetical protein